MKMITSISLGFVTNSSSMVYHIPREVMQHPKIQEYLKLWDIESGVPAESVWDRSKCALLAVTPEQKAQVQAQFKDPAYSEYPTPAIHVDDDSVLVMFGDEHTSVVHSLVNLIRFTLEIELHGEDFH